jgi:hypothetical protein
MMDGEISGVVSGTGLLLRGAVNMLILYDALRID